MLLFFIVGTGLYLISINSRDLVTSKQCNIDERLVIHSPCDIKALVKDGIDTIGVVKYIVARCWI